MKIYSLFLQKIEDHLFDEICMDEWIFKFVICAIDEKQARQIASDNCGGEGKERWLNPEQSSCRDFSLCKQSGVICQEGP